MACNPSNPQHHGGESSGASLLGREDDLQDFDRPCLHAEFSECRQPQRRSLRGRPTKHRQLCQQVEASIALQGAPGILIGLGAFFAGVALAAFLLAAIPTLVVCTAWNSPAA